MAGYMDQEGSGDSMKKARNIIDNPRLRSSSHAGLA